jgi:hypothetical protein
MRRAPCRLIIKPIAAQSLAIRTIRDALEVGPRDYTDAEIAHLVLAGGLADLNRALDEIMADTIYSNAEGFTGFDFSDEKTLRAVKDVRHTLRQKRHRQSGRNG